MSRKRQKEKKMNKKIILNSIDKVKDFATKAGHFEENITLQSGRYVVNGKSIMGIFSLDLTQPMDMIIEAESEERAEEIWATLDKFEFEAKTNVA